VSLAYELSAAPGAVQQSWDLRDSADDPWMKVSPPTRLLF